MTRRGFCEVGTAGAGSRRRLPPTIGRELSQVAAQCSDAASEALRVDLGGQDPGVGATVVPPLVQVSGVRVDDAVAVGVGLQLTYVSGVGEAAHLTSKDSYNTPSCPVALPAGSPEEALDCACGLYLNNPTAWLQPPTN